MPAFHPFRPAPVRAMARAAACCAWGAVPVRPGRPAGVRKHVRFPSTGATLIDPGEWGLRAP